MAKLSLQFHADRSEVLTWVATWAHEMNLFLVMEVFSPEYQVKPVDKSRIGEFFPASDVVSRVSLSLGEIDTDATSALDFLRRNPGVLVVSIGAQTEEMLRESTIAAMTDDGPSMVAWKVIRNKAKALMRTGAVSVLNPVSGTRQCLKSHYYSEGAQELAGRGVRMLASAGWNEFEFDS